MQILLAVVIFTQTAAFLYIYSYVWQVEKMITENFPTGETYRTKRDAADLDNALSKAGVEFFNPGLRSELEEEDVRRNSSENWVWLTSYSRIPVGAHSSVRRISWLASVLF